MPGLALSSEPGNKRSINLGDCPEKLGRVVGGVWFVSSNKLLKLLVTVSGSNRGLGNSRMYGGVLISNIGGWSKCRSGKAVFGVKVGGDEAAALKKDSCIEMSSVSTGVEVEEALEGLPAGGSGGLFRTIESADY